MNSYVNINPTYWLALALIRADRMINFMYAHNFVQMLTTKKLYEIKRSTIIRTISQEISKNNVREMAIFRFFYMFRIRFLTLNFVIRK